MIIPTFGDVDGLRKLAKDMADRDPTIFDRAFGAKGAEVGASICRNMIKHWRANPIIAEYVQHVRTAPEGRFKNTKAWQARAEQLFVAIQLASQIVPEETECHKHYRTNIPVNVPMHVFAPAIANEIAHGMPYLWRGDIVEAIISSPPLPTHIPSRAQLPYPWMFWSYEVAFPLTLVSSTTGQTVDRLEREINWIAIIEEANQSIAILHDLTPSLEDQKRGAPLEIVGGSIKYGEEFPPPGVNLANSNIGSVVLKMLAFLNSPYVTTTTEKLPRGLRKRCTAAGVPSNEVENQINVLTLRQPERKAEPQGGTKDWQHQWWVSGHFRAQWYPTEQAHRVIWIAPHVKGPAGLPFVDRVYDVKR